MTTCNGTPLRLTATLVAVLTASGGAAAQEQTVDDYTSAPLQNGAMLSLWGAEPAAPGTYALALGLQAPFPDVAAQVASETDARSMSSAEAVGTFGAWRDFDFTAALAVHHGQRRSPEAPDQAEERSVLGDVRLAPRWRLLGDNGGSGFAVLVPIWVPAGHDSLYGEAGIRFEPRLAATHVAEPFVVTANTGYLLHPAQERWGTRSENAVSAGLGGALRVYESWSILTEAVGRSHIHRMGSDGVATELRAAGRFASAGWVMQAGGGRGLSGGGAQVDWRLIANVSFSPGSPATPDKKTPLPDRDGDSIEDTVDGCPDHPEDHNGVADLDGCPDGGVETGYWGSPEQGSAPAETDEDALAETATADDETPEPCAERTARQDDGTCAPLRASTPDRDDAKPLLEIREVVLFEPNEMHVDASQEATLDAVAAQLEAAPHVHVVVEGHSDGTGPQRFNHKLSRMRATTVRLHLIRRGISWKRLRVAAYGASRPVVGATANSHGSPGFDEIDAELDSIQNQLKGEHRPALRRGDGGQTQNRRVSFRVIQQRRN